MVAGGEALCPAGDHVGERERVEVAAHQFADLGPHREQCTLTLVVARPVLVRLAEVTDDDRTVDRRDDRPEGDRLGGSGEHVSAPDPPLRADEPGALPGRRRDVLLRRYGWGRPVRSAMSRTEVGVVSPERSASESNALLA